MAPELQAFDDREDDVLSRYEYDDRVVYAADLGPGDAAVDVVEDTVMVVRDGEQADFDVPEPGTAEATVNNGVLTVEVEQ